MDIHYCEIDDEAIIDHRHLDDDDPHMKMKFEWNKQKILKLKVVEKIRMMQKIMMNLSLQTCGNDFVN